MLFYVYGLKLKRSDEFRYIGCTGEPDVRKVRHLSGEARAKGKRAWVDANRDCVEMVILATVDDGYEAEIKEANLISKYRRMGHRLFNQTSRSCGRWKPLSEETKEKLSKPKKRRMTKSQRAAALREWFRTDSR